MLTGVIKGVAGIKSILWTWEICMVSWGLYKIDNNNDNNNNDSLKPFVFDRAV